VQKNSNNQSGMIRISAISVIAMATMFGVIAACSDGAKAKPNYVFKDPPKAGVLAKIGGQEITEEELIGEDKVDFFDLKKREYELKMERLNKLLVDKLIGAEAQKAGVPLEDYIAKNVTKGEVKVSDSEFKKFVKEKRIPESQINAQIKERINQYLQQQKKQDMVQAYVAKLTKSNPIEVYFNKPKMNVQVDVAGSPMMGGEKAPVTIVEFSDFQCPFCSRAAETVTEIKKKYGSKVRVAFKHFPLPMHREARPASEASMCVNEQSSDKFWKYHDLVFKNQDKLDNASLEKYAKDVGANVDKFKECMAAGKYKDAVQKDLDYGEKIGVKSTPTFFVNGQLVAGALPIEAFSEIIDEELADAKK
jgi:protein-disulfide isomerase